MPTSCTLQLFWPQMPPESYLWFKTLHIVGVVVWFAGLFYLVRLFIYHAEADAAGTTPASGLSGPVRVDGTSSGQHHRHPRHGGDRGDGRGFADPPARLAAPELDACQAGFRGCSAGLSLRSASD